MRSPLGILPILISMSAIGAMAACSGSSDRSPAEDDGGRGGGSGCVPTDELCDGVDNNCDGLVDEGCQCTEGDTQSCYSGDANLLGVGACVEGTQTCNQTGAWGACDGEVLPNDETCDGADNDCNGSTDEGFSSVTCGLGICQVTVEECVEGVPQPCLPGPADDEESCNGIDDTCDGQIDEGCSCTDGDTQPCYSGSMQTKGVGLCEEGLQTCQNGSWGACNGEVTPTTELCDGLDNDCDGTPDDGNPQGGGTCNTGQLGVCAAGVDMCQGGSLVCTPLTTSSPEVCDTLDNDCDGVPDDGDPGGGANCAIGGQLGICADGTEHCVGGNVMCQPDFPNAPIGELCNGLDDDCDGTADDGNPEGGGACNTGLQGVCAAGAEVCMGAQLVCQQTNLGTAELCNGLDDDCDGTVDDGNPGGGQSCNTGLLGVCAAGTTQCSGGASQCQQNTTASAEVCGNAVDEDCDGILDNGCPGCGNGVIEGAEDCDDGNTTGGDGCGAGCAIEFGSCCSGEPSSCIDSPVVLTYSNLSVAIPDGAYDGTEGSMGCVNLNVDICAGTISDMNVSLGIDHGWAGDVTVRVISPSNTTTTLLHRPGFPASVYGDSSNLASSSLITFDDSISIDPETMGSTLTTSEVICQDDGICSYFPDPDGDPGSNLGDLNGEALGGTWRVCVGDSESTDAGTLQTIQLRPTFN